MGFLVFGGFYNFFIRHGLKSSISQILIWCLIFFTIIIFYAFRFEMNYVYRRVIAVLVPSYNWTDKGQIIISRSSDGHFYVNASVNDVIIKFMIDTGASDVALTRHDASRLKFDLSKLNYTRKYSTANGISLAAPVTLSQFAIGSVIFKNVIGHIGSGELDVSLLGMSLLERFASFKIDKDLLILTNDD